MLVVSRKRDECVDFYERTPEGPKLITSLVVVQLRGDKVRLGLEADRDRILIVRREVSPRQEVANAAG
jgi:sRNA-binding carbon storage regulator CsrA